MAKIRKNSKGAQPNDKSKAAAKDNEVKGLVIPKIAKGALQLDVGPMVIAGFAKTGADMEQATNMLQGARAKQYDLQAMLVNAICKAATVDKSIDLSVAFGEDTKPKAHLNNQIGLALGWRAVYEEKGKQVIGYSKTVAKYFPQQGVEKDSPEYKQAATFRTNWSHRLTQCIQVACGILDKGMTASIDKETKTLRLAGPEIKKQFGSDSVLLNEKQTQQNKKGEDVKLKEKPSFTAIAVKAGEAHGKTTLRGGHGTNRSRVSVDPGKALEELAKAVVSALEKLKDENVTDTVTESCRRMANAIRAKVPAAMGTKAFNPAAKAA